MRSWSNSKDDGSIPYTIAVKNANLIKLKINF